MKNTFIHLLYCTKNIIVKGSGYDFSREHKVSVWVVSLVTIQHVYNQYWTIQVLKIEKGQIVHFSLAKESTSIVYKR